MGKIEDKYCLEGYDAQASFNLADEIIAKLEARVAALEGSLASHESRGPDPSADREIKWAIIRNLGSETHVFDREDGFRFVVCEADLADGYVALFQTRDDAIDVIDVLGLEDLGSDGAPVRPVRVYTDRMEFVGD